MSAEFGEHADEERQHAMWAAERITQLGGEPGFDAATLTRRAHITYETFADDDLAGMLKENLAAEPIVITTYQEIIRWLGADDTNTRRLNGRWSAWRLATRWTSVSVTPRRMRGLESVGPSS